MNDCQGQAFMTTGLKWNKQKCPSQNTLGLCLHNIITAKDIAEEIEPVFPIKRSRQKKKQFSYEGSDKVVASSEEVFKRDVFLPLVDSVISSLIEQRNN